MFYLVPYPFDMALLLAPFPIIRTGGYLYWKRSDANRDSVKSFYTFDRVKPEKYWVPWSVILLIQLAWAIVVLLPVQYLVR